MNANTIYNQRSIDEQFAQISSLLDQKQNNIAFDKQRTLQKAQKLAIMNTVNILPPNNQNLQFSSLHVPKPALESL